MRQVAPCKTIGSQLGCISLYLLLDTQKFVMAKNFSFLRCEIFDCVICELLCWFCGAGLTSHSTQWEEHKVFGKYIYCVDNIGWTWPVQGGKSSCPTTPLAHKLGWVGWGEQWCFPLKTYDRQQKAWPWTILTWWSWTMPASNKALWQYNRNKQSANLVSNYNSCQFCCLPHWQGVFFF